MDGFKKYRYVMREIKIGKCERVNLQEVLDDLGLLCRPFAPTLPFLLLSQYPVLPNEHVNHW